MQFARDRHYYTFHCFMWSCQWDSHWQTGYGRQRSERHVQDCFSKTTINLQSNSQHHRSDHGVVSPPCQQRQTWVCQATHQNQTIQYQFARQNVTCLTNRDLGCKFVVLSFVLLESRVAGAGWTFAELSGLVIRMFEFHFLPSVAKKKYFENKMLFSSWIAELK